VPVAFDQMSDQREMEIFCKNIEENCKVSAQAYVNVSQREDEMMKGNTKIRCRAVAL
jgi:hypothetical protein